MTEPNQHEAFIFWCNAYRNGTRVTYDGSGFVYHSVDPYRIHRTKTFGLIEIAPCEPSPELMAQVGAIAPALLPLLTQSVPADLAAWWFHPLALDYEARPLAAMAARRGVSVWLQPCPLGIWPQIVDSPADEVGGSMPALSPILAKSGYSFNMESYRILGEKYEQRKNGNNRVADNLAQKVQQNGS